MEGMEVSASIDKGGRVGIIGGGMDKYDLVKMTSDDFFSSYSAKAHKKGILILIRIIR